MQSASSSNINEHALVNLKKCLNGIPTQKARQLDTMNNRLRILLWVSAIYMVVGLASYPIVRKLLDAMFGGRIVLPKDIPLFGWVLFGPLLTLQSNHLFIMYFISGIICVPMVAQAYSHMGRPRYVWAASALASWLSIGMYLAPN